MACRKNYSGYHQHAPCGLVDVNQPVSMVFTRWLREDSFPVSRAPGGTFFLPQDQTPPYVKITRSTNLLSVCRRKIILSTYARSQLVDRVLAGRSEFCSITWRMIRRSAGYKIHFRKQPPFRRNFFPLVWYLSFLWISTPWQFGHGSRVFVQLNKTFTQTMRECFGYFTQLAETSFF